MDQPSEKVIGQITYEKSSTTIEWKIHNYFALSQKVDKEYSSPSFNFLDAEWYLQLVPNGEKAFTGCVGLYLYREQSETETHDINFTLGIRNCDGSIYQSWNTKYEFQWDGDWRGTPKLVRTSSIWKNAHKIAPDKHLAIFCNLNDADQELDSSSSDSEDEDEFDELPDTRNLCYLPVPLTYRRENEMHTQKESLPDAADVSERLPDTGNPSSSKEDQTHTQKESLLDATDIFSKDMKRLFVSERFCDVKILVKGKELQAHKAILAARSSVFSAMFEHEMIEKKSNNVEILDCEFDVFKEFLRYLYTGKLQEVSKINVCELYVLADKYDVQHLERECIAIMNRSISVDNICDIISLALKFNESELLTKAKDYFKENAKSILLTVNWQSFMAEAPTVANELFIKTLT